MSLSPRAYHPDHSIVILENLYKKQKEITLYTFELHNINFPFCHSYKCLTIIPSRFKLQNLPGSLSLRDMQMIAQIKQLLPSTRNITTQTKKYGALLPYLYSYYTGKFFVFFS